MFADFTEIFNLPLQHSKVSCIVVDTIFTFSLVISNEMATVGVIHCNFLFNSFFFCKLNTSSLATNEVFLIGFT